MNAIDYILDGLVEALELERELGVRAIEVDRTQLVEPPRQLEKPVQGQGAVPERQQVAAAPIQPKKSTSPRSRARVVFIHDRPLASECAEMMEKIIRGLDLRPEEAPIVTDIPIPDAGIYVFLGARAIRRYMPNCKIGENCWGKSPKGKDMLLVRSPEEIVRFSGDEKLLEQLKRAMWRSLKGVQQRLLQSP